MIFERNVPLRWLELLVHLLQEPLSVLLQSTGKVMQFTHVVAKPFMPHWIGGKCACPNGLPELAPFEVHSPRVARLLACNPGRFTLHGTNCYIVGKGKSRAMIDTGEGRPEFDVALLSALAKLNATISTVLVTHRHHDHIGGVKRMHKLFPDAIVRKFPECLRDEERIWVDDETTLRVLFTPGHCDDHCCFILEQEAAIFSGDNVLGCGSTWFEDLVPYMASLGKMLEVATRDGVTALYPGHGPPSAEHAVNMIANTADHRNKREKQILDALQHEPAFTSLQLVRWLYDASLPISLLPAAQSNVLSHLHKLKAQGSVARLGIDRWGRNRV